MPSGLLSAEFLGEFVKVVVGVGAAFEGQVWWGYPFAGAVGELAGVPAAFFDKAVVGSAAESKVVDVGGAAVGPVTGGVVDLAGVAGCGAVGEGAAAVFVVQDDALIGVGDAFGAAQS